MRRNHKNACEQFTTSKCGKRKISPSWKTLPPPKKKKEKKKARLGNNKINTLFKSRRPAVKGQSTILPLNCVK